MKTRKSLLFSAGVVAIVALFAATNVFAQSSCTSKTTSEATGNFVVNVTQSAQNGRRIYTYTMTSPTGKNPNKFFVFVKKGLNQIPGDLVAKNITANTLGTYLTPDFFSGANPPSAAWNVVHHQDGVGFTNVAVSQVLQLDVSERYKPEESVTTVLLSIANTYEHCGPIYGPTTPAPPEFQGSPLVQTISTKTFADGCIYDVVADETGANIISMALNPNSPANETVCGVSGCKPCAVTISPFICEAETGFAFCPPLKLGQPPIQSTPGGTCYYPANLKFTC